jgi:hypothetical protein
MKIFTVLKDPKAIKTLVGTAMLHEGASNVLPVPNDLDWIAPGDLYRGDVRDEATKKDPGITFIEVTSADGYTFFLAGGAAPVEQREVGDVRVPPTPVVLGSGG